MGNNRFSDGLLLGLLIGGSAVFLLGTKKGNKILSALTEEGLEGLTDLIETLDEKQVVPKTIKKTENLVSDIAPTFEEKIVDKIEEKLEEESKPNGVSQTSHPKKFFRKSK